MNNNQVKMKNTLERIKSRLDEVEEGIRVGRQGREKHPIRATTTKKDSKEQIWLKEATGHHET